MVTWADAYVNWCLQGSDCDTRACVVFVHHSIGVHAKLSVTTRARVVFCHREI